MSYYVQHFNLVTQTWENLKGYPSTNLETAVNRVNGYREQFTDKCYRLIAAN